MTRASTKVGRGPYRTGVRRREQIIDAATAVFAEYGYAGGAVRTIADRIGVSPASLLQHFGSKEGLLMAVLEDWDRHTVEARLTDVTGLDYFRRLPEVMAAHLATGDCSSCSRPSPPRRPAPAIQPTGSSSSATPTTWPPSQHICEKPSRPARSPSSPRPRSTRRCVW